MDWRKKRRGRGKESIRVFVKVIEGEREVHCFVIVDLLLCCGSSGLVEKSHFGIIS